MRYLNWDVLLFEAEGKIPLQEFRTVCHAIKDPESHVLPGDINNLPFSFNDLISQQLPVLSTFTPSLSPGTPFRISIHCWEIPRPSLRSEKLKGEGKEFQLKARVFLDGHCVSCQIFPPEGPWPRVINTTFEVDTNGTCQPLIFPKYYPAYLTNVVWSAEQALGRIKVLITEGFIHPQRNSSFEPVDNIIEFSFHHVPLETLEASTIAWPNPKMWLRVPMANYNQQHVFSFRQPLAPLPLPLLPSDKQAHSPRGRGRTNVAVKANNDESNQTRQCVQPIINYGSGPSQAFSYTYGQPSHSAHTEHAGRGGNNTLVTNHPPWYIIAEAVSHMQQAHERVRGLSQSIHAHSYSKPDAATASDSRAAYPWTRAQRQAEDVAMPDYYSSSITPASSRNLSDIVMRSKSPSIIANSGDEEYGQLINMLNGPAGWKAFHPEQSAYELGRVVGPQESLETQKENQHSRGRLELHQPRPRPIPASQQRRNTMPSFIVNRLTRPSAAAEARLASYHKKSQPELIPPSATHGLAQTRKVSMIEATPLAAGLAAQHNLRDLYEKRETREISDVTMRSHFSEESIVDAGNAQSNSTRTVSGVYLTQDSVAPVVNMSSEQVNVPVPLVRANKPSPDIRSKKEGKRGRGRPRKSVAVSMSGSGTLIREVAGGESSVAAGSSVQHPVMIEETESENSAESPVLPRRNGNANSTVTGRQDEKKATVVLPLMGLFMPTATKRKRSEEGSSAASISTAQLTTEFNESNGHGNSAFDMIPSLSSVTKYPSMSMFSGNNDAPGLSSTVGRRGYATMSGRMQSGARNCLSSPVRKISRAADDDESGGVSLAMSSQSPDGKTSLGMKKRVSPSRTITDAARTTSAREDAPVPVKRDRVMGRVVSENVNTSLMRELTLDTAHSGKDANTATRTVAETGTGKGMDNVSPKAGVSPGRSGHGQQRDRVLSRVENAL